MLEGRLGHAGVVLEVFSCQDIQGIHHKLTARRSRKILPQSIDIDSNIPTLVECCFSSLAYSATNSLCPNID